MAKTKRRVDGGRKDYLEGGGGERLYNKYDNLFAIKIVGIKFVYINNS